MKNRSFTLIEHERLKSGGRNDGFTLIELLVVIAIIGFISSIIMINMWGQRDKARDANIQSYMHQVRNAAEMNYVGNNESYTGVCDEADDTLSDNGEFGLLEEAIKKDNGDKDVKCFEAADKSSFAVSSPLSYRSEKYWCVESVGFSQEIDSEITSAACE